MKVLLCTKHDIVGNMMLNLILPRIAPAHRVEVVLANRHRREAEEIPELALMKLFEQDLPRLMLMPLLDSQPPADGRWLSFEALSRQHSVPMTNAGHIARRERLTELVAAAAPDLVVSFQFGFIFRPEALRLPAAGALNLHSGVLPQRGGVNPSFWCMKDDEPELGCTLHWMSPGIDEGPIAALRTMPVDYQRSFFHNWMANYAQGAAMIVDAVLAVGRGECLPTAPQDPARRGYVPTPTPEDFRAFAASGKRLIEARDYLELLARYLPDSIAAPPPG
jgi:methionyl-tRNA formyltransferase